MKNTQSKHGGANVRVPPPVIFLVGILAGALLNRFVHAFPVPTGETVRVVTAAGAGLAGLAVIFSAQVLFRRTGQDPRPWKPTPELVERGPYRCSRNPIYLAMVLVQCSVGLALDDFWIVILSLPALLGVHFTAVLPEERYLLASFGESYAGYMARVPRYLGWPRGRS